MDGNSDRGQFERYRLMLIAAWPDSEWKTASLASARAALERELGEVSPGFAEERVVFQAAA